MAVDTLSDEELFALLEEAEQRLKHNEVCPTQTSVSDLVLPAAAASSKSLASCLVSKKNGAIVDKSYAVKAIDYKISNDAHHVVQSTTTPKAEKPSTGPGWYNMPRTVLTPELKRDLQLLRNRSVLDPHRHYKKEASKPEVPEFSQVGTVIEGPTEYFSGRLSNKERKRTFLEEVLAGESATKRFKTKYEQIQARKTDGKKAHYKKVKALRSKGGHRG